MKRLDVDNIRQGKKKAVKRPNAAKIRQGKKKTTESKKKLKNKAQGNQTQEDCQCRICKVWYSKNKHGEEWIRCVACENWDHTGCAKISSTQKQYLCINCTNS